MTSLYRSKKNEAIKNEMGHKSTTLVSSSPIPTDVVSDGVLYMEGDRMDVMSVEEILTEVERNPEIREGVKKALYQAIKDGMPDKIGSSAYNFGLKDALVSVRKTLGVDDEKA